MEDQIQPGAVGIDFGSSRSVIAVVKKKGVDVLVNEASHRETINIVSYGEHERFTGEQGKQKANLNFRNTVKFANRLLGLSKNYPKIREETKWITSQVKFSEDNKILHEVQYKGQKQLFQPEQVVATMLQKLKAIIRKNNLLDKEVVLSIPSYYTEQEKKALKDAAAIADLKINQLLPENAAISLTYGLFRKKELDSNASRNVVFVDFGHSKFSAFCTQFTKENGKILAQVNDRHLGARDLDWILLNFYAKIFEQKSNGLSVFENKKATMRLLNAIEAQRKNLSANPESTLNIESFMEEIDFEYHLSRKDYEGLIQPVLDRIREHIEKLVKELVEKKINIHSVEVVGGATRIPAVGQIIQDSFKQEIMRTLNASECIARGCALQHAILHPFFNVASFTQETINPYPIKISWAFFQPNQMEIENIPAKTDVIFPQGCSVPSVKSLNFKKSDGILINLFYDPAPEGFDPILAQYKVHPSQPKEPEFSVKIKVKIDPDGFVSINEASLTEEWTVEEKVLKEKPKQNTQSQQQNNAQQQPADQQQQQAPQQDNNQQQQEPPKEEPEYEIKTKKKSRIFDLKYDETVFYCLTKKQFDQLFALEAEMFNNDKLVQETVERKNELETMLYTWREHISGSYSQYIDQATVQQITQLLDNYRSWLDGEGINSIKSQYTQRIDELKKLIDPIQLRYNLFNTLPSQLNHLNQTANTMINLANTNDPKYEHILPENRQKVVAESQKVKLWAENAMNQLQKTALTSLPQISIEDINNQAKNLQDFCNQIMNAPKPEPKKEEKPAENQNDKKAENTQNQNQQNQNQDQQKQKEKMDIE